MIFSRRRCFREEMVCKLVGYECSTHVPEPIAYAEARLPRQVLNSRKVNEQAGSQAPCLRAIEGARALVDLHWRVSRTWLPEAEDPHVVGVTWVSIEVSTLLKGRRSRGRWSWAQHGDTRLTGRPPKV